MLLASELKRKSIHLASLVIPVGFYFSSDALTPYWKRGLLALVIVALAIEVVRLNHPRTRTFFRHFFGELLRGHEEASLLGSTYHLIACLLTIHLFSKPVAVAALGYLILGDTVAAIVGKSFGKILMFGKSLEGAVAMFATCVAVNFLLPEIPVRYGLIAAAVATVFEILPIPLDDNFRVPLSAGFALELLLK
jgi:dolichol kinase